MASSTVTSINTQPSLSSNAVTLASTKEALSTWRQNKRTRNEKIPDNLWGMMFHLLQTNPADEPKVLSELGITRNQLDKEKQRRQLMTSPEDASAEQVDELDFCEVTNAQEPSYPLAYKPAESFSTTTSVVELYRKDGMVQITPILVNTLNAIPMNFNITINMLLNIKKQKCSVGLNHTQNFTRLCCELICRGSLGWRINPECLEI